MSSNALNQILIGSQIAVTGLNLAWPATGAAVPVVIRKLPQKAEVLDPPVQITICRPDKPEGFKRLSFGKNRQMLYTVVIAIVSPNNADQISNLATYTDWRQTIVELYTPKFSSQADVVALAGCDSVRGIKIVPGIFLDRKAISDNYDYQVVAVEFKSLA